MAFSTDTLHIRPASLDDAARLAGLYNHFILSGVSTFDERPYSTDQFRHKLEDNLERSLPWLLCEYQQQCLGFAGASAWKEKSAYRFCAETSIYLAPQAQGHGLGRRLYESLLQELIQAGKEQAIACITLPNAASEALHAALGFQPVGRFSKVGFKHQRWLDVAYWQCALKERPRNLAPGKNR